VARDHPNAGAERAGLPVLSLGEPAKRCFLGSLKRFLGGVGVPTLSLDAADDGELDTPTDSFASAGFGFLPNGLGFRGGVAGRLVSLDGAPDTVGASAGGSVNVASGTVSSGFVGMTSVGEKSA
jgi:hypothetical protein